ncbi:N-formylglutamate amidohydrolase [Luteimonas pelagia]
MEGERTFEHPGTAVADATCFEPVRLNTPVRRDPAWDVSVGNGPVIVTAIHDGHAVRPSLVPYMAIDEQQRRREEDPLTGLLASSAGDTRIVVRDSRFQVDLNRPRERAVSTNPADTWGLRVWRGPLPQSELEASLDGHDRFYRMIGELVDRELDRWGCLLVLDLHSYNHRRDGPEAAPAEPGDNPDIDLGVTTLDHGTWGDVLATLRDSLRRIRIDGRHLDVRDNVRYPDGGHFPEWLHATYGKAVCTVTLEFKKIFMDEWSSHADLAAVDALRCGLRTAVEAVRPEFLACR